MALPIHKLIEPNPPPSSKLTSLPTELLASIVSYLPNRDIKSVRRTCKLLHGIAHLRLTRVFLSPNPKNIKVFREIANHETFRKGIVEIIYDDARLAKPPMLPEKGTDEYKPKDAYEEEKCLEAHEAPLWFVKECDENAFSLNARKSSDADTPTHIARTKQLAAQMTYRQSWDHYQHLLLWQDHILRTERDIRELRFGLSRFPSLKRITITAVTHGYLYY
ncbi:hypothetical protein F4805DRAFT_451124 [Annulohypoxylon moriforme]|nr:hypothetical protein F4805DRAFT_451124 [Annulohypoxylon moriforme]